ncbi:hypothetical protein AUJ87_03095 [Candidatus Gracilibacteria bacterium CG1_02_38_174]|nr:MAG: hypothetical protein AUJ87_03095 [Candidatus Gracilibacteria bacterium CG1_02_38_174]PIQ11417.1 MAG: hypothetical protein COW68_02745 [Candidatus Gracilibacteria bacterium CG18_big_fil_WC_8_21_14_2_50_38_16]PIQ41047.1 MAG: hypothetical protein COW06_04200 [Candidatus Gracilibacteria bacterium CG12_big_fil_rev_8_21_14_0_65_38_15]PIZ01291.1 MAG: hypothetical protein COY60_04290 [Candidatus Gracilibacteria bacterium CG_4_10_14_0_8_um_filter_38_28]
MPSGRIVNPSSLFGDKTELTEKHSYSAYFPKPECRHLSPFSVKDSAVGRSLKELRYLLDEERTKILRILNQEDGSFESLDQEKTRFITDAICEFENKIELLLERLEYTNVGQGICITTQGTEWELYRFDKETWVLQAGNEKSLLWQEMSNRLILPQYITISPDGRLLILNNENIDIYKDWLNNRSNMTHLRDSSESLKELGIMTFSSNIIAMKFIESRDFDKTMILTQSMRDAFDKTMVLPKG